VPRKGAVPIFAGAQVIVPIIVLLFGIHKMVDHRTENHAVLLTELFGFIVVIEDATEKVHLSGADGCSSRSGSACKS
jgi:hypothetical protein